METNNYKRLYNKGKAMMAKGNRREADRLFRKVIKINPSFAPAYWERSLCLFNIKNQEDETIKCIKKYMELDQDKHNQVSALCWLGASYAVFDDTRSQEQVFECLEEAMELDPESSSPYFFRGMVRAKNIRHQLEASSDVNPIKNGQFEAAARDFLKAEELGTDENSKHPLNYLFTLFWDDEGVIEVCTKLLIDYPSSAAIHFYLGMAYQEKGETVLALECLNKSIKINPASWTAHNHRGIAYKALSKFYAAIRDFTKAIKLRPTIPFIYSNRATVYFLTMEIGRAMEDFGKAISLSENGDYKDRLCKCLSIMENCNFHVAISNLPHGKDISISASLLPGQKEPYTVEIRDGATRSYD